MTHHHTLSTSADFVVDAGILTYINARHSNAHKKIIIIDRQTEEKNAENLLCEKGNRPLVDWYILNLEERKGNFEVYVAK